MTAIGPQVRIRDLRKAHGLTIAALVERIAEQGVEVTADHISNVETGRRRAGEPLKVAWAKALGINPLDVHQPEQATADAGAAVA